MWRTGKHAVPGAIGPMGNVECAAENLPVLTCARWQPSEWGPEGPSPPASIPKLSDQFHPESEAGRRSRATPAPSCGQVRPTSDRRRRLESGAIRPAREGFVAVPSCSPPWNQGIADHSAPLARRAPSHSQTDSDLKRNVLEASMPGLSLATIGEGQRDNSFLQKRADCLCPRRCNGLGILRAEKARSS